MKIKLVLLLLILSLVISLSGCFFDLSFLDQTQTGSSDGSDNEIPDGSDTEPEDKPQASGPVTPTSDGYTFESFASDKIVEVADIYEASSVLDEAIAMHLAGVTLDVSSFGENFDILTDFDLQCEFSSHVWFRFTYAPQDSTIITVHINYNKTTASKTSDSTEENTYNNIASANDLLSRASVPEERRRGDSFTDFPIDTDSRPTREVYNSEELWWVVEKGYRPIFPIEDSIAEKIYNQAKDVLRNIIYRGMSDYEKALAIYEYIVSSVTYDYDAASDVENIANHENACYYLEGVFLNGRAVCDGKSKAFVLLCGIEGIDAVREFGYSVDGTSGHAWNYVKIDDIWYVVDTTNGDVAKNVESSSLAQFFDKNVEIINYKLFLAPLSTFDRKYILSGIWKSITDTDVGQSRVSDVLINRLCDSYIERSYELETMLDMTLDLGVSEFSLVISLTPLISMFYGENAPHELADNAIENLGLSDRLEYLVYKESIDRNSNYMYVFKLLHVAE